MNRQALLLTLTSIDKISLPVIRAPAIRGSGMELPLLMLIGSKTLLPVIVLKTEREAIYLCAHEVWREYMCNK